MSDLDKRLTDYYQSKTLNSSRMQAILAQSQRARRRRYYPALAAAAVLLVAVIGSWLGSWHQYSLKNQQTTLTLREAAMNHATRLQVDVEAGSLSVLQKNLNKLPFNLVMPEGSLYERLSLIGGRYCTISGNLAAHLKFTDPGTTEQYSLFMTPVATNLKSVDDSAMQIVGVDVSLWQENDVVYALAKSSVHSQ